MSYPYRTTYRSQTGYIEDRGHPYAVESGDSDFAAVDAKFGTILAIGQTAVRSGEDEFEVVDGFPLLDTAKERRLQELHDAWLEAEASGTVAVEGFDGWRVDANERANRDVSGLVTAMEASGTESAAFCGADNSFRVLTLAQLKAVQLAIIGHAQKLYERKWELREAIGQAQDFKELGSVQINFGDI